ncbi:MAG: aldehyde dehydrogenase family protein [Firmicutes bacterium]|nr:aldehyde dehydrogenase family protein [Bacillota bacterium]MCL5014180.1 aldehyde dehydrogenase family protein [Bacillota bacterium]HBQ95178.1 hypothetical protein [Sulfobacillus sp.]
MTIVQEEIFEPIVAVMPFDGIDESINRAKASL